MLLALGDPVAKASRKTTPETLRRVYHCDRKRVIWGIHAGKIGNADTLLGYKKLLPLKLRA